MMGDKGSAPSPEQRAETLDADLKRQAQFVTHLLEAPLPEQRAETLDTDLKRQTQFVTHILELAGDESNVAAVMTSASQQNPILSKSGKPGTSTGSLCNNLSSDKESQEKPLNTCDGTNSIRSTQPTSLARQRPGAFQQFPGAFAHGGPVGGTDMPLDDGSSACFSLADTLTPDELNHQGTSPETILPRAQMVCHECDQESGKLQQAVPAPHGQDATVQYNKSPCSTSQRLPRDHVLLLLLVLLMLAAGVTLGIILSGKETSKEAPTLLTYTMVPTTETTTESIESHVLSLLPDATVRMIVKGNHINQNSSNDNTTDTPQAQAYNWLLQDPHLELYSDRRLVVRFVLATLYFATGGSEWVQNINWLSHEHHECNWYYWDFVEHMFNATELGMPPNPAVPCHEDGNRTFNIDEDATFRNLWLPKNNLYGSIPLEFYLLTDLQGLILYENQLEGTLATEIGHLTELKMLSMIRNSLSGNLPTQLGLLTNLRGLSACCNTNLVGNIPSELGLLTKMEYLFQWSCGHTGTLPSELGLATKLTQMMMDNNKLTGTIPSDIGLLVFLKTLTLYNNTFTGKVPSEIGGLSQLIWFWSHTNELTGAIPSELGLLSSLEGINLVDNMLSGTIPQELGSLDRQDESPLQVVRLAGNQLSGMVPESWCTGLDALEFDCSDLLCGCDCPCK